MNHSTRNRSGFTLTELLVVITVITMLAAISLGGLAVVRKQSNIDRTRRTIQKIHFLLMEKLEEYQTKRVKVDDANIAMIERVSKMYDLMRMEMPDRASDLGILSTASFTNPVALDKEIAATKRYLRKYNGRKNTPETEKHPQNCPSAEFLYMIIMDMPNAAEQFAEFEIGDADGDGLREFVDAWGNPIKFIRWPVGFTPDKEEVVTDLQPFDYSAPATPIIFNDPLSTPAPGDPFDPNGVISYLTQPTNHMVSFPVYPLVYSAGPDKKYDINTGYETYSGAGGNPDQYQYELTTYSGYSILNPFKVDGEGLLPGEPLNEDKYDKTDLRHTDNITNHALDYGKAY